MDMSLRLPIPVFVPLLLLGCVGESRPAEPDIRVEDAWARAMPLIHEASGTATNSAVYLTLWNVGTAADRLLGARTSAAASVELHRSLLEGDVMRMEKVDALELPPDSIVELRPGGLHLMLLDLAAPLEDGDEMELTLFFEQSGELVFRVPVGRVTGG
jgi:copper(I)-binding protein